MEDIKFSVIMPAYNAENEILSSIESVLNQTYFNYELIIVDDCSNDKTYDLIKKVESENNKIKVIRHDINKKAGGARNTGIKEASGEYILFLDSDDVLHDNDVLLKIRETLGNDRPDIVYLGFESVGDTIQGIFLPNEDNSIKENRLLKWNYANVWDVLWKKEFITDNKMKFVEGKYFEDFVFYYTGVLKSNSYKFTEFPTFIYNSGRKESMTTKITPSKIEDLYYNMMCFASIIDEVDEKYKSMIIDILKDHNRYANELLNKML